MRQRSRASSATVDLSGISRQGNSVKKTNPCEVCLRTSILFISLRKKARAAPQGRVQLKREPSRAPRLPQAPARAPLESSETQWQEPQLTFGTTAIGDTTKLPGIRLRAPKQKQRAKQRSASQKTAAPPGSRSTSPIERSSSSR